MKLESSKVALKAERAWFFLEEKERGLQRSAVRRAGANQRYFERF